jgi:CBS domain-containing protein
MKLADFLAPSRVLVPLACETLDGARVALLARLEASGAIADLDRLQLRVAEERGEDMVAIADRAFLLHYRTDTASALQVAVGVSREGVRRSLDEGAEQRAPVVVMVVGPPRSAARQLQVVRAFGRLLPREEAVAALVDAPSAESIVTLPMFVECEIPEQILVRDLMTERPRTTTPEIPLRRAARELIRSGLGALPVVDHDERFLGNVERAGVDATPARDGGVVCWDVAPCTAGASRRADRARRDDEAGVVCGAGTAGCRSRSIDEQQRRRARPRGA